MFAFGGLFSFFKDCRKRRDLFEASDHRTQFPGFPLAFCGGQFFMAVHARLETFQLRVHRVVEPCDEAGGGCGVLPGPSRGVAGCRLGSAWFGCCRLCPVVALLLRTPCPAVAAGPPIDRPCRNRQPCRDLRDGFFALLIGTTDIGPGRLIMRHAPGRTPCSKMPRSRSILDVHRRGIRWRALSPQPLPAIHKQYSNSGTLSTSKVCFFKALHYFSERKQSRLTHSRQPEDKCCPVNPRRSHQ